MERARLTANDAGCWVDGHWGQYAVARMVQLAGELGYDNLTALRLADKHLASIGPSTSPALTDAEYDTLTSLSDDAENWLNEHLAPEGYSFRWEDGEFFLAEDEDDCDNGPPDEHYDISDPYDKEYDVP